MARPLWSAWKTRVVLCAAAAGAIFLCSASPAAAAHPCGTIEVANERPARVATVRVSCQTGREVALAVYEQIAEGKHRTEYKAERFTCQAVLAETEVSCRHHDEWIFASTQPTDHPGEWHVPHKTKRRPYWRHCAPVRAVVSGDMLTHKVNCSRGRRVIRKVLAKSQTAQSPHIHVLGYTCGLRPYASRPITCHKGMHRIVSPLAG
jgi:hypothetical protein